MTSNDVSSKVWNSENDEDQAELILKRILYGFELKIHYAMVTIMISFIFLGLLLSLIVGLGTLWNTVQGRIQRYDRAIRNKKRIIPKFARKKIQNRNK